MRTRTGKLTATGNASSRCRANSAHIRQSRPDSGLDCLGSSHFASKGWLEPYCKRKLTTHREVDGEREREKHRAHLVLQHPHLHLKVDTFVSYFRLPTYESRRTQRGAREQGSGSEDGCLGASLSPPSPEGGGQGLSTNSRTQPLHANEGNQTTREGASP